MATKSGKTKEAAKVKSKSILANLKPSPKPTPKASPKGVKEKLPLAKNGAKEKVKPTLKAPPVPPTEKISPKIMTAKEPAVAKPKKLTKAEKLAAEALVKADSDWLQLQNQYKALKPVPYMMSEDFQAKTVISHKVLGIGFVLKNQNNRIEVLFRDGKRTLITNYKK